MAVKKIALAEQIRVGAGLLMAFSGLVLVLIAVIMSFEVVWIPVAGVILLIAGLVLAGPKRFIGFLLSLPPS